MQDNFFGRAYFTPEYHYDGLHEYGFVQRGFISFRENGKRVTQPYKEFRKHERHYTDREIEVIEYEAEHSDWSYSTKSLWHFDWGCEEVDPEEKL